ARGYLARAVVGRLPSPVLFFIPFSKRRMHMLWTSWRVIRNHDGFDGHAVYGTRITCAGQPIPLGRLLGIDQKGLLSYGRATNLTRRLRQFITGMDRCYGHSSANMWYILQRYSPLREMFPDVTIEYSYFGVRSEAEAKVHES